MNPQIKKAVANVVDALVSNGARTATKYLSPTSVVRATRRTFKGKIQRGNAEISLVIGKPNYDDRDFIARCKKAGEPFPVKKIRLRLIKK